MKVNPYHKYLGKEDMLQHAVINYVKYEYPKALIIHVPNEGKRTKFMQYKVKYLGVVRGVPDVLIFNQNNKYTGLAIELKWGRNTPTEHQMIFLEKLKQCGWYASWENDFDTIKKTIDQYFKNEL